MALRISTDALVQRSEQLAALRAARTARVASASRLEQAADSAATRRPELPMQTDSSPLMNATGADRFRAVMALDDTAAKSSLETARISARQVYQDTDRSSTRSRLL